MNKLFDSMMGGKPILYAVNAPNNYIKEFDCGISVEAESAEALKAGILELINLPEDVQQRMGENGRNAALSCFNYKVLSQKFMEILESEIKEKSHEGSFNEENSK